MTSYPTQTIAVTYGRLRNHLAQERGSHPYWTGELSGSAVATAIAAFALSRIDRDRHAGFTEAGLRWLASTQNRDGGWGDSPESPSNVTATVLTWASFSAMLDAPGVAEAARSAERWLDRHAGARIPLRSATRYSCAMATTTPSPHPS